MKLRHTSRPKEPEQCCKWAASCRKGGGSGLCHWTEWVGRISRNTTQEVIIRVSTGHLQKLLAVVTVLPLMLFSQIRQRLERLLQ